MKWESKMNERRWMKRIRLREEMMPTGQEVRVAATSWPGGLVGGLTDLGKGNGAHAQSSGGRAAKTSRAHMSPSIPIVGTRVEGAHSGALPDGS